MAELNYHSDLHTLIIQPFCRSTVEFIWDTATDSVSRELLYCVIIQCVVMTFNSVHDHHCNTPNKSNSNTNDILKVKNHNSLHQNGVAISKQKFSPPELLLITDSTLTQQTWGDVDFETRISQREHGPIKLPAVLLLSSLSPPMIFTYRTTWLVEAVFSTAMLIQLDYKQGSLKIGTFSCEAFTEKQIEEKCGLANINLNFFSIPEKSMTSFESIYELWKLHRITLNFGPVNRAQCASITSYEWNPGTLDIYEDEPELCSQINDTNLFGPVMRRENWVKTVKTFKKFGVICENGCKHISAIVYGIRVTPILEKAEHDACAAKADATAKY
ncbi:unnamed protein product [Orchesella dallaii]|uniref:Uncharacterized protein n=1 Tax=Orchesella dallaii TaxID=48710 RepID=A0ABP1PUA4_9HEXA